MFSIRKSNKKLSVIAPVQGLVKAIEEVNDPVFAEKMMGEGIAISYAGGGVYAPIAGVITTVIPSNHAFGIRGDDGMEILVHVGLETVNLKGKGFHMCKCMGERVEAGDKMIEVDYQLLCDMNLDLITPIINTNSQEFTIALDAKPNTMAKAKETVLYTYSKK